METEGYLLFLNIDVYRRPDHSLGHTICRKPTHTNILLNARSSKQAFLSTLVHRATTFCDLDSLHQSLDTFQHNGYSSQKILQALNPPETVPPSRRQDRTSVTFLPFVGTTLNCVSKELSKHNNPPRKFGAFVQHINDKMTKKSADVYSIPCKCVYFGQTGRSIETGVKEHHWNIHLYHRNKSTSINLCHTIQLQNTSILVKKSRCMGPDHQRSNRD
jgi:hypothetical protein